MSKQQASDLHLKPMRPPLVRVQGKLIPIKTDPLKPADLERMLLPLLNRVAEGEVRATQSVDFGYGVPGVARFRANMYMQRGTVGAVFRRIPIQIMPSTRSSCRRWSGLADARRAGPRHRSDRLRQVDHAGGDDPEIAEHEPLHIVTIEDPIEFLFQDKVAVDPSARWAPTRRRSGKRCATPCARTRT